jgi:hypothetical protein
MTKPMNLLTYIWGKVFEDKIIEGSGLKTKIEKMNRW